MKRIMNAGADEFCPNPLPTSVFMDSKIPASRFHFMMTMIPLTAAYLPGAKLYPMLNVQDASEEWNVLKHEPVRFERDLLTEQLYRRITKEGALPAASGYLICLGDGIAKEDWTHMRNLFSVSFSLRNYEVISPVVLWSDHAMDRYLDEYPFSLRPSIHKELWELASHGALIGAAARTEDIAYVKAPLFVSGFDLLSVEEQQAVIRHPYPVIATAHPDFKPASVGFTPDFLLSDTNSPYGGIVFGKGVSLSEDVLSLMGPDDNEDVLPENAVDPLNVVLSTVSYRKVSDGFFKVIAALLNRSFSSVFSADGPMVVYAGDPGQYKLYLYNTDPEHYSRITVRSSLPVESAAVESSFPRLPLKYLKNGEYLYDGAPSREFRVKIAPDGVSVIRVTMASCDSADHCGANKKV
ncbi:MAG: hypothetical protein IK088_01805 [Lachnospiraceae bacterium]|nr:hypothetical protein [Lachnospiraceae bacterium]MBR4767688.1 hypothetical protein [Lachnospiraceae bacterium]